MTKTDSIFDSLTFVVLLDKIYQIAKDNDNFLKNKTD